MSRSVYELREFYATRAGRLVRRLLSNHMKAIWPDMTGMDLAGCGYAAPYLKRISDGAECTVALMLAQRGVHHWPENAPNLSCLCAEDAFPLGTESVDRILMIHGLEHAESPALMLQEAWRVLRSNGRILLVVPNRLGFWARVDWTPFGHGTPFTAGQVGHLLRDSLFVTERSERGLLMPPFRSFLAMRTAYTFESFGRYIMPGLAGVHLVEAVKQVYAPAGHRQAVKAGRRRYAAAPASPARSADFLCFP